MPKTDKTKIGFAKMRSSFFFGLIIILGISILYIFRPFIYPIFWAAIIAMLFYPLYNWLNNNLKAPNLSSFLTLIVVIVVIFLPLIVISTLAVNESISLYKSVSNWNLTEQIQGTADWLNTTALSPIIKQAETQWTAYATDVARTFSVFLFNNIKNITQNSLRFILMLFLMFYSLFFFLKDGNKILKRLMLLSPLGNNYELMLYNKFRSAARATLKGTFIVGAIQGTLGGIIFWVAGVEGAFIWAIFMTLLSLIPAVGCSIIWFPTGLIMLITGHIWQGLTILLFGLFVISTIDNFIRPKLVGKDIQLHPLLVLLSTLGGIAIFGISGFVIGPIIAALFVASISIYEHHYRNELINN